MSSPQSTTIPTTLSVLQINSQTILISIDLSNFNITKVSRKFYVTRILVNQISISSKPEGKLPNVQDTLWFFSAVWPEFSKKLCLFSLFYQEGRGVDEWAQKQRFYQVNSKYTYRKFSNLMTKRNSRSRSSINCTTFADCLRPFFAKLQLFGFIYRKSFQTKDFSSLGSPMNVKRCID